MASSSTAIFPVAGLLPVVHPVEILYPVAGLLSYEQAGSRDENGSSTKGCMVNLEIDSKKFSQAGQALDMCLKLIAPENSHKPWNRHERFHSCFGAEECIQCLFAYTDSRFGCLSRAAAVLIYNFDHLEEFLTYSDECKTKTKVAIEVPLTYKGSEEVYTKNLCPPLNNNHIMMCERRVDTTQMCKANI